jgi:hypothetical protein
LRTRGRVLAPNEGIILFSFVQLNVPCHPFPSPTPAGLRVGSSWLCAFVRCAHPLPLGDHVISRRGAELDQFHQGMVRGRDPAWHVKSAQINVTNIGSSAARNRAGARRRLRGSLPLRTMTASNVAAKNPPSSASSAWLRSTEAACHAHNFHYARLRQTELASAF